MYIWNIIFETLKTPLLLAMGALTLFTMPANAQDTSLSKHPFMYVGEWDTRKPDTQSIFMVKKGKVTWKYTLPLHNNGKIQEFDDVTLLPNGDVVFAAMSKVGIISSKTNKIKWEFKCPEGTESHSCQPIGKNRVLIALNGVPGKLLIYDTKRNKLIKEIPVPTAGTNTHGQFRHARMTKDGTFTTGLYKEKLAVELDKNGNIVWQAPAETPWAVLKLNNGNYLVSGDGHGYTREYNPAGDIVWEVTQKDVPFKLYNNQSALRLANGNTIICNWVAGNSNYEEWKKTVQFFEITPDKQIVWQVSSWDEPDLGPCTYLQLLDEPGNPGKLGQQR